MWERRWHPLREEWIVYAAHRNNRPWTTGTLATPEQDDVAYDPSCYLCPGNARIGGAANPAYPDVFVFDNDHPVLGPLAPSIAPGAQEAANGIYLRERANGLARVICYSPQHNQVMAQLPQDHIYRVLKTWQAQTAEMKTQPEIVSVLIFENNGKAVGVSNPHPHGQLYAAPFVFTGLAQMIRVAQQLRNDRNLNLFDEILKEESRSGERIVAENEDAVAFIPFFACFAFETMVFPRRRQQDITTCTDGELMAMAEVLQKVLLAYNAMAGGHFPYVLTLQQAPLDAAYPEHHWFIWLMPPMRAPGLLKYFGGPELANRNFMADTLPEEKAAQLRAFVT